MKSWPLAIALVLTLASHIVWAAPPAEEPWNFVVIVADDLGVMDLGAFNPQTFYETPRLNRLAQQGMRFTEGYAACPVCSPTRASLMTGLWPPRTGITDYIGKHTPANWDRPTQLLPAPYDDRLALQHETLAELLRARGYATFFAGKWHLGSDGFLPEDQGFDINRGGIESGGPYGGNRYFSPYGNRKLRDGPPLEHLPDRLATETINFIHDHRDGPFLAYLSFYSVHTPLIARPDLQDKYTAKARELPPRDPQQMWGQLRERKVRLVQDHAVYAAMVESMDQAVGRVLDALDQYGLAHRTVVIFTSDNGGLSTSEGHPTSNVPFKGGKGWPYEGGVRVPWIVRAPGLAQPGTTCSTPIISIDLLPTLSQLSKTTATSPRGTAGSSMDGRSFVPLLRGESLDERTLYWHYPHYGNQGGAPCGALRQGEWKLIEWFEDHSVELYNLRDDIGETRNLADENPQRVAQLRKQLEQWRDSVKARMPTINQRVEVPKKESN